ncbi:MAG: Zn-ribbon domain-containing OB-fold protein [Planctomycetota bacterium]|jgi:uncharacterized OB-fold protein
MFSWFGKVSFVPYTKISDFAVHLKNGRLMGSACKSCGYLTFPPRADCPECLSGEFEYREYSGKGRVYTHTLISAAPTGFDDDVPYHIAVVDLDEGGRLMAWTGETIPAGEIAIDQEVQVVPRIIEETEAIKVYYSVEKPGTTWGKAPS